MKQTSALYSVTCILGSKFTNNAMFSIIGLGTEEVGGVVLVRTSQKLKEKKN